MQAEALLKHFRQLDRSLFLEEPFKVEAKANIPLPIGFGQTISQPTLVAEMSILLDPGPASRILEIGTGSGYQTALLAPFCATVFTVERIEALALKAQVRLAALGYQNIRFKIGDGSLGWPEHAPYDRIIVTAGASAAPPELLEQLAQGGRMIIPLGSPYHQVLTLITKELDGEVRYEDVGGVVFVELVGKYGWGHS